MTNSGKAKLITMVMEMIVMNESVYNQLISTLECTGHIMNYLDDAKHDTLLLCVKLIPIIAKMESQCKFAGCCNPTFQFDTPHPQHANEGDLVISIICDNYESKYYWDNECELLAFAYGRVK